MTCALPRRAFLATLHHTKHKTESRNRVRACEYQAPVVKSVYSNGMNANIIAVPVDLAEDEDVYRYLETAADPELWRRGAEDEVGRLETVSHQPHQHHQHTETFEQSLSLEVSFIFWKIYFYTLSVYI